MTTYQIPSRVSPTLHPLSDVLRRFRQTEYGLEAEMNADEAKEQLFEGKLWWEVSNQASALFLVGRTEEALHVARKAFQMQPAIQTYINLAVILETMGRFDEAMDYTREACGRFPLDDRATALYGEALLRMGRFAEGWPYYRKNRASMQWLADMFLPEWEGPHQDLKGKKVVIIEGGGFGDNTYFLRWLFTLQRWGAQLTYVCQPSYVTLSEHLGIHAVANWQGNVDIDWKDYDYFCPLLSIAGKLGVTLENYRWLGPYVKVGWDIRPWRSHQIGFCWKAGEAKSPRKQRSLTNEQRARIVAAIPRDYRWVNLSHGTTDVDMENPSLETWLGTAQVLRKLDLVITVDTGIAHLAGAMGISTWTLLPGAAAWQYPLGHTFHPLYPTMRIVRNPGEGMEEAADYVAWRLREQGRRGFRIHGGPQTPSSTPHFSSTGTRLSAHSCSH